MAQPSQAGPEKNIDMSTTVDPQPGFLSREVLEPFILSILFRYEDVTS